MGRSKSRQYEEPKYCDLNLAHPAHKECDGIEAFVCENRKPHPDHLWSMIGEGNYAYLKACPGNKLPTQILKCGQTQQGIEHNSHYGGGRWDYYTEGYAWHCNGYRKDDGIDRESQRTLRFCLGRRKHDDHIWEDRTGKYRCFGLFEDLPEKCSNKQPHEEHLFKATGHSLSTPNSVLNFELRCPGVESKVQAKDPEFIDYKCGLTLPHGPHVAEQPMLGKKLRCLGNLAQALKFNASESNLLDIIEREVRRQTRLAYSSSPFAGPFGGYQ